MSRLGRTVLAVAIVVAAGGTLLGALAAAPSDRKGASAAPAARPPELRSALIESLRRSGAPGATAAVVAGGELVWAGATGRARSGPGGAMRAGSLFPIASTTKTVTAALAMRLAEQRRLELDSPIGRRARVPGKRRITPRQLMNHSAGLREYFADGAIDRLASRRPYRRWRRGEVLRHVKRLRFRPGSRNVYSNSGYVVLGGVISRAARTGVDRLFRRLIAAPLDLGSSRFRYGSLPQRRFAHPLRARRGGWRERFGRGARVPTDYWGGVWTDGGLASSATELALINDAVYSGDLLEQRSIAAMLPPRPGGWGLGTFDRRGPGGRWIGHDGSYGGYQSEAWTNRSERVTVVVLTNAAGNESAAPKIWKAVAEAANRTR